MTRYVPLGSKLTPGPVSKETSINDLGGGRGNRGKNISEAFLQEKKIGKAIARKKINSFSNIPPPQIINGRPQRLRGYFRRIPGDVPAG